ncbi:basic proline-rich protein-like [Choloepus didactylus]|uniref:basic proline-rich protein-like n=1 Tax=Choloepus didactylus TaxID=27675 RepID=UPI00189EAC31|nr:basic proline-rich protein-like [Choloepus didactylus]
MPFPWARHKGQTREPSAAPRVSPGGAPEWEEEQGLQGLPPPGRVRPDGPGPVAARGEGLEAPCSHRAGAKHSVFGEGAPPAGTSGAQGVALSICPALGPCQEWADRLPPGPADGGGACCSPPPARAGMFVFSVCLGGARWAPPGGPFPARAQLSPQLQSLGRGRAPVPPPGDWLGPSPSGLPGRGAEIMQMPGASLIKSLTRRWGRARAALKAGVALRRGPARLRREPPAPRAPPGPGNRCEAGVGVGGRPRRPPPAPDGAGADPTPAPQARPGPGEGRGTPSPLGPQSPRLRRGRQGQRPPRPFRRLLLAQQLGPRGPQGPD